MNLRFAVLAWLISAIPASPVVRRGHARSNTLFGDEHLPDIASLDFQDLKRGYSDSILEASFCSLNKNMRDMILSQRISIRDWAALKCSNRDLSQTIHLQSADILKEVYDIDTNNAYSIYNAMLQCTKKPAENSCFEFIWTTIQHKDIEFKLTLELKRALAFSAVRHDRPDILELLHVRKSFILHTDCLALAIHVNSRKTLAYLGLRLDQTNLKYSSSQSAIYARYPYTRVLVRQFLAKNALFLSEVFEKGSLEAIKAVIEAGIDVSLRGPEDQTALDALVSYTTPDEHSTEYLRLLLDHGADMYSSQDSNNLNPFDWLLASTIGSILNDVLSKESDFERSEQQIKNMLGRIHLQLSNHGVQSLISTTNKEMPGVDELELTFSYGFPLSENETEYHLIGTSIFSRQETAQDDEQSHSDIHDYFTRKLDHLGLFLGYGYKVKDHHSIKFKYSVIKSDGARQYELLLG